jgi:hypothetical protein
MKVTFCRPKAGLDDKYAPMLSYTAMRGHSNMVKLLIRTGKANVEKRDSKTQIALLEAVKEGVQSYYLAIA